MPDCSMKRTLALSALFHVLLFSAVLLLSAGLIKGSLDMAALTVFTVSLGGENASSGAADTKEQVRSDEGSPDTDRREPSPEPLPEPSPGAVEAAVEEEQGVTTDQEIREAAVDNGSVIHENPAEEQAVNAGADADSGEAGDSDQLAERDSAIPAGVENGDGEQTSGTEDRAATGSGNSPAPLSPSTIAIIGRALERAKTYPLIARKRGLEGTVYVSFLINPDGRPRDIEVLRSSGFAVLDTATVHLIKRAAPYPHVESRVEVPVAYQLGP